MPNLNESGIPILAGLCLLCLGYMAVTWIVGLARAVWRTCRNVRKMEQAIRALEIAMRPKRRICLNCRHWQPPPLLYPGGPAGFCWGWKVYKPKFKRPLLWPWALGYESCEGFVRKERGNALGQKAREEGEKMVEPQAEDSASA